jgi:hypothetical protein
MTDAKDTAKIQIFRARNARPLEETGIMSLPEFTAEQLEGLAGMYQPDLARGEEVKVLVNIPGFSLSHAWFKKDFPLPRHSHDADCLYYIVAGSLKLGKEELGPRDSFFLPANMPYTYTPGPEGVELLEFRHANAFDFKLLVKGDAFWKRAAEITEQCSEEWRTAKMPTLNV